MKYVDAEGNKIKSDFPHCDSAILHPPKTCIYCDHYPEEQQARIINKINFTGEHDTDKRMCPSENLRPLDTINRWGGNRARPHDAESLKEQEELMSPLLKWIEKQ